MKPIHKRIITEVRKSILLTHNPDSCIGSTRLLQLVLQKGFNIDLQPKACTVVVYNPHVTKLLETGVIESYDQLIATVRGHEGWSVGVGLGAQAAVDPKKWAGHLIGTHEDGMGVTYLWDPSLDLAHRPQKNMHVTPICDIIPGEFYNQTIAILMVNDCLAVYTPKPEAIEVLERSADWLESDKYTRQVEDILETLG